MVVIRRRQRGHRRGARGPASDQGSVNMYCLEKDEEMPTVPDEKNAGIADGVVINNSWAPKAILGEGGKVAGIELMRCVSVRDAERQVRPGL
ncbi:MAG: hypothetical protein ACLSHG_02560 [Oscillospiraceae bacterium]